MQRLQDSLYISRVNRRLQSAVTQRQPSTGPTGQLSFLTEYQTITRKLKHGHNSDFYAPTC